MDSQAQDIVKWAEKQTAPPANSPAYRRLTDEDRVLALQMAKRGCTQTAIAEQLGVTQSSISQWLSKCQDTTDHATQYLRGSALRMARNIVQKGLARDHIQALNGLGVLQAQDNKGLTLIVNGLTLHGTGREPAIEGGVLSPPVLTEAGEGEQKA